jgi:long-chain acyl-CoA synthetase
MLNLGRFVREHALHYPARVAVRMGDTTLDYGTLDAMSDRVAGFLRARGIEPGEKVALSCPNLPYFPVVYYGILKAGCVVVPLNVLLKAREIGYHLRDSDAAAYFVFEGTPELPMAREGGQAFEETPTCRHLVVMTSDPKAPSPVDGATTLGAILVGQEPLTDIHPSGALDTAVILYTSGTTGQPKGAELSQLNMVMNAIHSNGLVHTSRYPPKEHAFLMALPLFHSFGQTVGMNSMFYGGGSISMLPRFDPGRALEIMLAHRITVFAGVPTMYWALLNAAATLDDARKEQLRAHLQFALSGGAALPVEILRRFEEVYGIGIMEGYGLSETSPVASFNHADRERRPGTIGQPIFGCEMRVVDEDDRDVPVGEAGEIVIRGHNVMKGYYKRPDATAEALRGGWFHSGDIGVVDADGYFSVVDRLKDMILRGGFNVYPREVEEVLMTHPAVSLAAVVGVPHDEHGEEIKAFVVLADGESLDADVLIAWSREQMAAYKYPRLVEFRSELPMNATGKILRRTLRDQG